VLDDKVVTANTEVHNVMMAIICIENKLVAIEAKLNDMSKNLHKLGE
jgi:hypothetical protein